MKKILVLSSAVADSIFFFAAHRIDVRFVQGAVGVYEQHIGYAFWLYFAGTVCMAFALFGAIGITCTLTKNRKARYVWSDLNVAHKGSVFITACRADPSFFFLVQGLENSVKNGKNVCFSVR